MSWHKTRANIRLKAQLPEKMVSLAEYEGQFKLRIMFHYDPQLVELVKKIPGRKYSMKSWFVDPTEENIKYLESIGFEIKESTRRAIKKIPELEKKGYIA